MVNVTMNDIVAFGQAEGIFNGVKQNKTIIID